MHKWIPVFGHSGCHLAFVCWRCLHCGTEAISLNFTRARVEAASHSAVLGSAHEPGKVRELAKAIHNKILPILEDQQGFIDEILLVSDTEPD